MSLQSQPSPRPMIILPPRTGSLRPRSGPSSTSMVIGGPAQVALSSWTGAGRSRGAGAMRVASAVSAVAGAPQSSSSWCLGTRSPERRGATGRALGAAPTRVCSAKAPGGASQLSSTSTLGAERIELRRPGASPGCSTTTEGDCPRVGRRAPRRAGSGSGASGEGSRRVRSGRGACSAKGETSTRVRSATGGAGTSSSLSPPASWLRRLAIRVSGVQPSETPHEMLSAARFVPQRACARGPARQKAAKAGQGIGITLFRRPVAVGAERPDRPAGASPASCCRRYSRPGRG